MKVLIVRLGAIGDVVHTLPALAAIRQAHPASHLAWAVQRGAAATLMTNNPCLDELIELDLQGWRRDATSGRTRREVRAAVERLRQANYDVSLDFQGLFKSSMIPWVARVPRRLGFAFDSLREPASGLLLTERIAASDENHVISKNLKLAAALGCHALIPYQFPIGTSLDDQQFIADAVRRTEQDFALLNPGGAWDTKLWSPQRFAYLAEKLWEYKGLRSIVTYGPGEESLAEQIVGLCKAAPVSRLMTSLKQFYLLAREARLFVGGDTGPMHLAAAAGTPIVALFGPTSARRNGPFSEEDVVIERSDLECRVDCYRRRCDHRSCMDIPTEAVWKGIVTRLESHERRAGVPRAGQQTRARDVEGGLIENV